MPENHKTRQRLSDILTAGQTEDIHKQWESTEVAEDFKPLPAGTYIAHVHAVGLFVAKTGTPGVKIQFNVCEGEHIGRFIFDDLWLTPAALPQTKRDCFKLGLDSLEKLEKASILPGRIRCKVLVSLRADDDGTQYNRVRRFDVLAIDEPESEPFAPKGENDTPPREAADGKTGPAERPATDGTQATEAAFEPRGNGSTGGGPGTDDTSFDFGLNAISQPDPTAWASA